MATKKKQSDIQITVNLVNAQTPKDVYTAFALAKLELMSPVEQSALADILVDNYFNEVSTMIFNSIADQMAQHAIQVEEKKEETEEKKPGMFRKVWNWVTRKK